MITFKDWLRICRIPDGPIGNLIMDLSDDAADMPEIRTLDHLRSHLKQMYGVDRATIQLGPELWRRFTAYPKE